MEKDKTVGGMLNRITKDFIKGQEVTGKALRKMNKLKEKNCWHCDNTGILIVANGPDDFDEEYCSCLHGSKLRNLDPILV